MCCAFETTELDCLYLRIGKPIARQNLILFNSRFVSTAFRPLPFDFLQTIGDMGSSASKPHDDFPSSCPIHTHQPEKDVKQNQPSGCPVDHDSVNPSNMMPNLPNTSSSSTTLSTKRATSTIPTSSDKTWQYPSPLQFHNALQRKGMATDEEHVDSMVDVHNFLNEMAWKEILEWEKLHG